MRKNISALLVVMALIAAPADLLGQDDQGGHREGQLLVLGEKTERPRDGGPQIGSEIHLQGYTLTEEERDDEQLDGVENFFAAGWRNLLSQAVPEEVRPRESSYYIVRFSTAELLEAEKRIREIGGEPVQYLPDAAWIVRMTGEVSMRFETLAGVEWVGRYKRQFRESPALRSYLHAAAEGGREAGGEVEYGPMASHGASQKVVRPTATVLGEPGAGHEVARRGSRKREDLTVTVHLFPGVDNQGVQAAILAVGGRIVDAGGGKSGGQRVRVVIDRGRLPELYDIDDIRYIELYVAPELHNDKAAGIMSVRSKEGAVGLTGAGQIIGHADSGLDVGSDAGVHSDFAGRIHSAFPRARQNDWSDWGGHGTHTAASILGNGAKSGGAFRGIAPEARLVHQSIADSKGGLAGIDDLEVLLEQAYVAGARIHSDSWGVKVWKSPWLKGVYGQGEQVDRWAWNGGKPKDMLVVFAAGNDGKLGAKSVGAPATAKNCLAVGASENNRPAQGDQGDNINEVAKFSSRGPVRTERFKPDVVAPGTWVVSARTRGDLRLIQNDVEGGKGNWSTKPAGASWAVVSANCPSGTRCWADSPGGNYANKQDSYLVSPVIDGTVAATLVFRGRWRHAETGDYGIWVLFDGGQGFDYGYRLESRNRNWPGWDYVVLPVPPEVRGESQLRVAFNIYSDATGQAEGLYVDDILLSSFSSWSFLSTQGMAAPEDVLDSHYTLNGGTSMAAPLAAGAAALVRQFLMAETEKPPSAELVKAFLINGAQKLAPGDARPNSVSGWGRIDVAKSLLPENPRTNIYLDKVEIEANKTFSYPFVVKDSGQELRATLVWADPPSESLVHDLDLVLEDAAKTKHLMVGEAAPNGKNNVEGVDIENPVSGIWKLQVSSSLLTTKSQPFAVVISGAVTAN